MSATPKATSEKSVHFHTSTVSAPAQKAEKTRTPTPTLSEKRAVFQRLRRLARETRAARPEKSTPQLLDLEETLRSAPASHTEIKREPGDKVQAPPPLNLLPVKRELGVDDFSEPQLLLTPVKEEPSETEPTQKRARTGPPTAAEDEPGAYELPRGVATTPENLVLTARLNRSINLHMITMKLLHHGAEYNPRRFCAMVLKWHMNASTSVPTTVEEQEIGEIHMHLRKLIKVSVLVFHAGKMVCTGAKNMAEAYRVLNMVTELIRSVVGSDIRLEDYTLENVVCSATLPFYIDLTRLAAILPAITTYNPGPKGFPGAILRHPLLRTTTADGRTQKITILVFHTGNLVITGARTRQAANHALSLMYPVLQRFSTVEPVAGKQPSADAPPLSASDRLTESFRHAEEEEHTRNLAQTSFRAIRAVEDALRRAREQEQERGQANGAGAGFDSTVFVRRH